MMRMNMRPLWPASVVLPLVLGATSAGAQSDTAAAQSLQLEEIIVTAQKREEGVQKAALSITALSGEEMAKEGGQQNLNQILKDVPGVTFTGGGINGSFFFIRGVGNAPTFGQDASVTLTVNGIFNQRGNADRGSIYDVNRVEVARGPQSTLTGRSSEGGAIAIVSNEPVLNELQARGRIEAGNYNLVAGEAVVNLPLADAWALRGAFSSAKRNGYATNGSSDEDTTAGRMRLLYQPNDALKVIVSADHAATGGQGGLGAYSGYIDLSKPFYVTNGYWFNPTIPDSNNKYTVTNLYTDINWNMGWAELYVQPTYQRNVFDSVQYGLNVANYYNASGLAGGYSDSVAYMRNSSLQRLYAEVQQKTIDVHLSNKEGADITWIGGFYYYRNEQAQNLRMANGTSTGTPAAAVGIAPSVGKATIWPESNHRIETNTDFYGQVTYPITPDWRITGGARHSQVTKERPNAPGYFVEPDGSVVNQGNAFILDNGVAGTTAAVTSPNPVTGLGTNQVKYDVPGASLTFKANNWKAVIEHDLTSTSLLYAMVSTGWKSGSFISIPNPDSLCTAGCTTLGVPYLAAGFKNSYDPEHLKSYEIGSKNTFFDNRLRVNASAFYYDYRGYQFSYNVNPWNLATGVDPDFTTGYTSNAKKAQSYGSELESSFLVTDKDKLDLNVAYLHAVFKQVEVASNATAAIKAWAAALTDTPLPFSPEWTVSPSYAHIFSLPNSASVTASIDGYYATKQIMRLPGSTVQLAQPGYYYQPAYWKGNASIVYNSPTGKWSLSSYVKNFTNKTTFNQWTIPTSFTGFGVVAYNPDDPRTYGIVINLSL